MRKNVPVVLALGLLIVACEGSTLTQPAPSDVGAPSLAALARPTHLVSVGGADICVALGQKPGCDANFSLTALERADGTVTGQYQDALKGSRGAVHVAVDCLTIVGNVAVVGGIVTKGFDSGFLATGNRAWTVVVDNGTSANDAPDRISFSIDAQGRTCADADPALFPLFDLAKGQVKIR